MALSTFDGEEIGTLVIADSGGTPQRLQTEAFPATDGAISIYHGAKERILLFDGILGANVGSGDWEEILDWLWDIEGLIGTVGTLLLMTGLDDYEYLNCRLDDFRRVGNPGLNSSELICRVRAKFTQLSWL